MSDRDEPAIPDETEVPKDDADDADDANDADDAEEDFDLDAALEPEGDLDDTAAADLESGIALPDLDEEEGGDEPSLEAFLLVGETLADDGESDDEAGPAGEDASTDLEEQPPLEADEGEGANERLEDLVSSELPALSADPEGELETGGSEDLLALGTDDDESPPRAELPWLEVPTPELGVACTAIIGLLREGPSVVAGGREIVTVDDAGVTHVLTRDFSGKVTSFTETSDGTLVFATSEGLLGRIAPNGKEVVRLHALEGERNPTPELNLGGPTPSARPAILLHVEPEGTLLESTDQGTTWRRVDLGGKVVALSRGTPPVCLVDLGSRIRLFQSEPNGGFSPIGGPFSIDGEAPAMASFGDVVVVLEQGRGVSVSANRGASFERVKASSRVTAVTAGRLGTRRSAFGATLEPASGRAHLLWIDAATGDAFVVASLEPSGDDDPDDHFRVHAIAWEPQVETLWVAGRFGVRRFRRPPSA